MGQAKEFQSRKHTKSSARVKCKRPFRDISLHPPEIAVGRKITPSCPSAVQRKDRQAVDEQEYHNADIIKRARLSDGALRSDLGSETSDLHLRHLCLCQGIDFGCLECLEKPDRGRK